ncbi:MAG: hypothetical protein LQ337_003840 [Flavoplaca oasis]|nr:MAG: hypothetical protein LQ337_003840 [Flavoplaca oasis]
MSLRHKLSRMWGQDTERPVSSHRKSSSEAKVQIAPTSDADALPAVSPKTLRKAASTTFQTFSNSLRSRAQAFYTAPLNQVEASGSPEPRTPRKPGHVSGLWSSVRGRGSRRTRSSLNEESAPLDAPETPTKIDRSSLDHSSLNPEDDGSPIEYTPIDDVPPKISTEIPQSSLVDANQDDVTTPAVTPTKFGSSINHSQSSTMPGTLRCEPKQLWPSPHMRLRGMTLVEPTPSIIGKTKETTQEIPHSPLPESLSAASDSAAVEQPILNEKSRDQTPTTDTSAISQSATRRPHIFESERKSSEDYKGTFWPAGKILKSSKRSSNSAESPYEADIEGKETSAEAGMGPREPWDNAQADRKKRHAALQSMHMISDNESYPNFERLREPGELAQPVVVSSSFLPRDKYTEEHSSDTHPESSAIIMTKKVNVHPLHAGSSNTERSNGPMLVQDVPPTMKDISELTSSVMRTLKLEPHQSQGLQPPPPGLGAQGQQEPHLQWLSEDMFITLPEEFSHGWGLQSPTPEPGEQGQQEPHLQWPSEHMFTTLPEEFSRGWALPKTYNGAEAKTQPSKTYTVEEASPEPSRTYDADESDYNDSSSDIAHKLENERVRATTKRPKPWTSACEKYARYTSTPTPSSPSTSPPREYGKLYVKTYHSTGPIHDSSDPGYPEAHAKRVTAYMRSQNAKYLEMFDPNEIDRSAEFAQSAQGAYLKLCQFIYQCERESQDEADAED